VLITDDACPPFHATVEARAQLPPGGMIAEGCRWAFAYVRLNPVGDTDLVKYLLTLAFARFHDLKFQNDRFESPRQ
jgi:hypothetical protein